MSDFLFRYPDEKEERLPTLESMPPKGREIEPWEKKQPETWLHVSPTMRFGICMGVVGFLGAFSWLSYQWLYAPSETPVLVQAEPGPFKVKPDHPGGLHVPHQDKLIYGHIDQYTPYAEGRERIVDEEEQEEILYPDEENFYEEEQEEESFSAQGFEEEPLPVEHFEEKTPVHSQPMPQPIPPIAPLAPPKEIPQVSQAPAEKKPHIIKTIPVKKSPPKDEILDVLSKSYTMKIGVFTHESAAIHKKKSLAAKYQKRGIHLWVERIRIGKQNQYYLYAGSFDKEEKAKKLCKELGDITCKVVAISTSQRF